MLTSAPGFENPSAAFLRSARIAAPRVRTATTAAPATGASPSSSSSGSSGSGGSTPPPAAPSSDFYKNLLANDTFLNQTLGGINASGTADLGRLNAGIQRGVINFGRVPQSALSAPGVGDAIDQTTRDLASQNTAAGLSTVAKLTQAYQQAQQGSDASLAARGLLRSGAYGQHATENLLGYNQAQDTATQQLLDYLGGLYNGYLSQMDSLRQQSTSATNDALNRLIQQISAGQITAPPPPVTGPAPSVSDYASGGQPDPFANLNNLTPQDWQRLAQLPVNRDKQLPASVAA